MGRHPLMAGHCGGAPEIPSLESWSRTSWSRTRSPASRRRGRLMTRISGAGWKRPVHAESDGPVDSAQRHPSPAAARPGGDHLRSCRRGRSSDHRAVAAATAAVERQHAPDGSAAAVGGDWGRLVVALSPPLAATATLPRGCGNGGDGRRQTEPRHYPRQPQRRADNGARLGPHDGEGDGSGAGRLTRRWRLWQRRRRRATAAGPQRVTVNPIATALREVAGKHRCYRGDAVGVSARRGCAGGRRRSLDAATGVIWSRWPLRQRRHGRAVRRPSPMCVAVAIASATRPRAPSAAVGTAKKRGGGSGGGVATVAACL